MKLGNLGDICPYCKSPMCCGAMSAQAKVIETRLAAITNGQCPDCGGTGEHDGTDNGRCITCNGTGFWDAALAEARAEVARLRAEYCTTNELADAEDRANAAEAECELLRSARDDADAETARTEDLLGLAQHERDAAQAEVARLREALADIAAMTDADDPQSYRSDDREGCLDAVYDKARRGQDAAGG